MLRGFFLSLRPFFRGALIAAAFSSLTACGTINMVGEATSEGLSSTQQELRLRAAKLSRTAWEGVKESSFMGELAGLLLSGKDEEAGPGLIPDTDSAAYTAEVYIAQTAQNYSTATAQLDAMIRDIQAKTAQAKAMVQVTEVVVDTYRVKGFDVARGPSTTSSSSIVEGIALARADRNIVEDSLDSARLQVATFATAKEAFQQKYPETDTSKLNEKLASFIVQVELISELSSELKTVTQEI